MFRRPTVQWWSVIAYQNNPNQFFFLVTQKIMLFHQKILLTSLNIYSDLTEKPGQLDLWNYNDLLYILEQNKKKILLVHWNYWTLLFKKNRCDIISNLKFNGTVNCVHHLYLPDGLPTFFMNSFIWKELKYRVQSLLTWPLFT